MATSQSGSCVSSFLVCSCCALTNKSFVDMVGPVGFELRTSDESFVYGYLYALLYFVIPPTGGLLTRCNIFWSPSSFLSRTHLLEWVWLDYGPSTDLKARGPTERPARKLSV